MIDWKMSSVKQRNKILIIALICMGILSVIGFTLLAIDAFDNNDMATTTEAYETTTEITTTTRTWWGGGCGK